MKTISSLAALLALIGTLFAGWFFLDARFARCADVKAIERRLDYKIENDQLMGMQQRLWQVQEKYPNVSLAPPVVQNQVKELEASVDMQRDKVKRMEKK
jgi:hypothetical protein